MLHPSEVIRKKRFGKELSAAEIKDFFAGTTAGTVADYQTTALLMAIAIHGMNAQETAALTKEMRDSGTVLQWPFPKHQVIDKHSTGGVGDKTSMIVLPLCLLEGLKVPMMSGRGLGHTGGTLDKLEAIPGMKVRLTVDEARRIVDQLGGVFIGQTAELAPLDKRLYALRDVTGTVESIPLITASILSKKAAEGIGGLVMDVKYGSGAFMPTFKEAQLLAESIKRVGEECGLHVRCLITDMHSPLGRNAGHSPEIDECVEVLQGKGPEDTASLSVALATEMVALAQPQRRAEEITAALHAHLQSGRAFEVFVKLISAQGAKKNALSKMPASAEKIPIRATTQGRYVAAINVRELGLAIATLGGGRRLVTDKIDHAVGLSALKHLGELVEKDEPVAFVHGNGHGVEKAAAMVAGAYTLGDQRQAYELIKGRI